MSGARKIVITPRWRRRLVVLVGLFGVFLIGSTLQDRLGISFSLEGLQDFRQFVDDLDGWGPVVFLLLCVFRLFIGLTSHLVFILGGLVFGAVGGILWGSLGLLLSALVLFGLARLLGTDWVERRFGDRYLTMADRIRRVGALAVFAVTAHPAGLLTPAHLAAGLVAMGTTSFTVAVVVAAPIRVAPYALLGTSILDLTAAQSFAVAGVLLLLFAVPLLSSRFRSWIWGESSGTGPSARSGEV